LQKEKLALRKAKKKEKSTSKTQKRKKKLGEKIVKKILDKTTIPTKKIKKAIKQEVKKKTKLVEESKIHNTRKRKLELTKDSTNLNEIMLIDDDFVNNINSVQNKKMKIENNS
jgi:hypothetical protein